MHNRKPSNKSVLDTIPGARPLTKAEQDAFNNFQATMATEVIPKVLDYQRKYVRRRLPG